MRAKLFFLCACLISGILGGYVCNTQRALKEAQTVYFKIAPVDPRALLSGDYMTLRYDFEGNTWGNKKDITLFVNEQNVATLKQSANAEKVLSIKAFGSHYRLPHQFYFQEGTGKKYELAVYAQAAVLPNGNILLTGLTDENFNLL
ncbi:MAG: GDYXXLXY domain-containing protein [Elusimicrobiaceae bacterium]|nr:GDYXXLXY domain-containing protein [Elusimicrobiaceae bacterium]